MIEILAVTLFFDILDAPKDYLPPPRYDYPFPGKIYVLWEDDRTINRWCSKGVACVIEVRSGECLIAINDRYRNIATTVLRHENGHCNGWTH